MDLSLEDLIISFSAANTNTSIKSNSTSATPHTHVPSRAGQTLKIGESISALAEEIYLYLYL